MNQLLKPRSHLLATVALLAPWMAMAESHLDSGATTTALHATAHVNFKIVIPTVLYLNVVSGDTRLGRPYTVTVMTTARSVTIVPCTRGQGPILCTAATP